MISPHLPQLASRPIRNMPRSLFGLFILLVSSVSAYFYLSTGVSVHRHMEVVSLDASSTLAKCRALTLKPAPPADFYSRTRSDRYEQGTAPVLIRNATIWTGEQDGSHVIYGDVLLDGGIIKSVGDFIPADVLQHSDLRIIEANGYSPSLCTNLILLTISNLQQILAHTRVGVPGAFKDP